MRIKVSKYSNEKSTKYYSSSEIDEIDILVLDVVVV